MDRGRLYERIDLRVDLMMKNGLLAEVEKLKEMGCTREMVSMPVSYTHLRNWSASSAI